jgi:uncharacterized protein (TIGR02246 family)
MDILNQEEALVGARKAYGIWFSGIETANAALAVSAVTQDVVQQNPSGEKRIGRERLQAALTKFLDNNIEKIKWELTIVKVYDDEVEVRVREETVFQPREGCQSRRLTGWHTGIVRREADGIWRISKDVGFIERLADEQIE